MKELRQASEGGRHTRYTKMSSNIIDSFKNSAVRQSTYEAKTKAERKREYHEKYVGELL